MVGVVLLALSLVGAVLYIIAWELSGERLPEPFRNRLPDRRRVAPSSPRTESWSAPATGVDDRVAFAVETVGRVHDTRGLRDVVGTQHDRDADL